MGKQAVIALGFVLCYAGSAFGQAADTPYQVRFATNLKKKDAIQVSNSGASSTVASPQNGRLCVNVYAFPVAGPMLDCCTCPVAANGLVSLGLVKDVLADRKPAPKSLVVKLLATTGGTNAATCNPATAGTGGNVLVTGMLAWKGEQSFTPATLSAAELSSLITQCGFLHATPNICPPCVQPDV